MSRSIITANAFVAIALFAAASVPAHANDPQQETINYIWRVHSIARYEERDGGVNLDLEAIAVTRDIPVLHKLARNDAPADEGCSEFLAASHGEGARCAN